MTFLTKNLELERTPLEFFRLNEFLAAQTLKNLISQGGGGGGPPGALGTLVEKTQRFDMGLNPHEPDRRVFSCSWPRSSSFLALMGQIVEFSRAHGSDRRVFSPSRARSSSFLVLQGQNIESADPVVRVGNSGGKVYLPPYPPSSQGQGPARS